MNTPAHVLIGVAAFARPSTRGVALAAVVGALLPDMSLYLMAGVALFVLSIPPQRVFDELYFSDAWQRVFAFDNSFLIWGAVLAMAFWRGGAALIAFSAAGMLHLALDFPLHHDDGRPHFWPATSWIFESPISYWDRRHHAAWIAPLEAACATCAAAVLWHRFPKPPARLALLGLLAAELWVVRQWLIFF